MRMGNANKIVFFDIETSGDGKNVLDIGAVSGDGRVFHSASKTEFLHFLGGTEYAIGHNIFEHDLKYLKDVFEQSGVTRFIDTLVFSPLLFPSRPYHKLVKDYKLDSEEVNNPLNDSKLCKELFDSEIDAFSRFDDKLKFISEANAV
ncbi:hypothetical protein AGMMS4952_00010 [Spirochaetia bacterium]|nr:hypothetical protein AGMMS4952_00010 [Spirochaetia bacterium]